MTLKSRISKLEQRDGGQSDFLRAYIEIMRAERIRLLNDPETLDRIRNEALRADGHEPLPPRSQQAAVEAGHHSSSTPTP